MRESKELTCIVCPMGCALRVEKDKDSFVVYGNTCPRGKVYGQQEMVAPIRNISSCVRVKNGFLKLCPVKTSREIPKDKIFDVMEVINKHVAMAPIRRGEILIENILGTGVHIVATRSVELQ